MAGLERYTREEIVDMRWNGKGKRWHEESNLGARYKDHAMALTMPSSNNLKTQRDCVIRVREIQVIIFCAVCIGIHVSMIQHVSLRVRACV
jgi:hypothetical protein